MPAMLDDPASPPIPPPPPLPSSSQSFTPIHLTLKDSTPATILPFKYPIQPPTPVIALLCDTLADEVEGGDTYPMLDALPLEKFSGYWFGLFATVMVRGTFQSVEELNEGCRNGSAAEREASSSMHRDGEKEKWEDLVMGSFYVKPNYPGRSSHVCNAGFLVAKRWRGRGVGKELGKAYLGWAPMLGYTYSVFNLVYETNTASLKIWDGLGFERIGRVKKCGKLKSYPDRKVDAIVYGYDFEEAAEEGEG